MTTDQRSDELAPSLARVARGRLCSGCGGCAAVAPGKIAMHLSAPGYLRPRQSAPLTPREDRRIAAICPGLGQQVQAGDRHDDPLWGPYLEMRTGHATDEDLRFAASSGGGLSAVLVHLLKSGQVDAVLQVGADPDRPAANVTLMSRTPAEVKAAAGSRYAPSAPLAALPDLLDGSGRYAVVGKPCDIAALRALARVDSRVDDRIPVMLSFFCAGVPSLAGAAEVLERLGAPDDEVTAFRYRGNGWPGRATATLADGSERSMSYHDSWGGVLSRHVQHRCKICADGTGVDADLVCADAWESDERGYPVFDEADGISLIVARTATGQALMKAAEQAGAITTRSFDPKALVAIQPGQSGRRRALFARLAGLRVCGKPIPDYRGLRIADAARQNPVRNSVKNFLGMVRRVARGRLG